MAPKLRTGRISHTQYKLLGYLKDVISKRRESLKNIRKNNYFSEELIAYFPYRNRRVQQLFYFCVCIVCRVSVFTETLPNHNWRIHIDKQSDGSRCHNIYSKFHKDWFSQLQVDRRDTQKAWWSHKRTFIFKMCLKHKNKHLSTQEIFLT
jgi:hypothetical protein